MDRPRFDSANPDLSLVRRVFLLRLSLDLQWDQLLDDNAKSFEQFVSLQPPRPDDSEVFARCVLDVFWQLVVEGVLVPGKNMAGSNMQNLPWFHRTAYGSAVIGTGEYLPHDPVGFLARLDSQVQPVDATVRAYVAESLQTFLHGNLLASMVMLGVAAERVFDLVCQSLEPALKDSTERAQFAQLQTQLSVRKRLDWVHEKLRKIEDGRRPSSYPARASLMVITLYDLMRAQRNDLGHPREDPPRPSREDAHAHLQIFPPYYATAERLRSFLIANPV